MSFVFGFLGIVFGILFLLLLLYVYIISKFRALGFKSFRISSLKKEIEDNVSDEPKQISGMTRVYLPRIIDDFKDFNIEEIFLLSEKSIRAILSAIENKDISILEGKDFNLINKKLKLQLEDLINSDILYKYDDIKFHKHAISNYVNSNGVATISISSSLEYYYSKKKDGKVIDKKEKKIQTRYLTKYVYLVNSDAYENEINVYGINCPNCGAVIPSLGSKKCKYCNTSLNIQVVDLLKCWKLIEFREIN